MSSTESEKQIALPKISNQLMNGFDFFLPGYMRKHFHSLAINRQSLTPDVFSSDVSVVVYANHASWWDPLIALYLRKHVFSGFKLYAPIDAQALDRYRIFRSMGFYGIEMGTLRGAQEFLRRSKRILMEPQASIWLTPEGRFCDARDHSAPFMPGLGHLASTIERWTDDPPPTREVWFVAAAFELTFWEERLPECLCWFGDPIKATWSSDPKADKHRWNDRLTQCLRETQRQLSQAAIARDCDRFEVMLSGASGTWRVYDWFRVGMSRLQGKPIPLEHGQKLSRQTRRAQT